MPVAGTPTEIRMRAFPPLAVVYALVGLLVLATGLSVPLFAQEIRIKVLDGRNGRPLVNKCINVWVDPSQHAALLIATNADGVASLRVTDNRVEESPGRRSSDCGGMAVTDPVVMRADTIRVTSATGMLCQAHPPDSPWLSFPIRKVLDSGDVTANVCGKIEASPKPGELIFFQRPRTFWERLWQ